MGLKDLLYQDNLLIEDYAFIWDKTSWINDKSFGGLLTSNYDFGYLNSDIKSGISSNNLIKIIIKYYIDSYIKQISLSQEYIQTKSLFLFLSDHLSSNIVNAANDTSLTLTNNPSPKFPCILIHKYYDYFNIWKERVNTSDYYLYTFERNNASITNINPSLSFTVTESITFPIETNTNNLEIYLSCWPIIPGSVSFTGGYTINQFELDYTFGIIRSSSLFDGVANNTINITYTTGPSALYIPSFIKDMSFIHPNNIDTLNNNSLIITNR